MHANVLFLFTLFFSLFSVFASPVPTGETQDIEKRLTRSGRGTYFHVGLGNCGKWNKDSDAIVAIPKSLYDKNGGSNCDQWVKIKDNKTGKVAYGKTRDSCPGCKSGDLDMSPSLFKKFASLDKGVINVSWNFMNKGFKP